MQGICFILAGGGGKGAYQIGIWKALIEYGVDKNIVAVSGTSVGALNAALFAQGNYNIAENIWLNISTDEILKIDLFKYIQRFNGKLKELNLVKNILKCNLEGGIFSRKGLIDIINSSVNLQLVSNSQIDCYSTCTELPGINEKYFNLKNMSKDKILNVLLASSALPMIFDSVEIEGKEYLDGGIVDNIPIRPLYDKGYRNFLVAHLNRDSIIDESLYEDAKIIQIIPSSNQGDLLDGTLDFTQQGAKRRIQQGYNDTIKILDMIYSMGMVQLEIKKNLFELKKGEQVFIEEKDKLINKRNLLKKELKDILDK